MKAQIRKLENCECQYRILNNSGTVIKTSIAMYDKRTCILGAKNYLNYLKEFEWHDVDV